MGKPESAAMKWWIWRIGALTCALCVFVHHAETQAKPPMMLQWKLIDEIASTSHTVRVNVWELKEYFSFLSRFTKGIIMIFNVFKLHSFSSLK